MTQPRRPPWDWRTVERALILGGTGFLGSAVVKELRGLRIAAVVAQSRHADLGKLSNVIAVFQDAQPELVIHAVKPVPAAGADTVVAFTRTMTIGMNILEACAATQSVRRLVILSEARRDLYGAAKLALTKLADGYCREAGMDILTVVPCTVYGPRFREPSPISMVISRIRAAHVDGQNVELPGDGTHLADYLHIEDAARGAVQLAVTLPVDRGQHIFHLGTGERPSSLNIAEHVRRRLKFKGAILWNLDERFGPPMVTPDLGATSGVSNWKPRVSWKTGVDRLIAWMYQQDQQK